MFILFLSLRDLALDCACPPFPLWFPSFDRYPTTPPMQSLTHPISRSDRRSKNKGRRSFCLWTSRGLARVVAFPSGIVSTCWGGAGGNNAAAHCPLTSLMKARFFTLAIEEGKKSDQEKKKEGIKTSIPCTPLFQLIKYKQSKAQLSTTGSNQTTPPPPLPHTHTQNKNDHFQHRRVHKHPRLDLQDP